MTLKEIAFLFAVIFGAFGLMGTIAMAVDTETYTTQYDGCVLQEKVDRRWPGYVHSVEKEVFCPRK